MRNADFEAFTFENLSEFVIKRIGNIQDVEIMPFLFWGGSAVSLISLFRVVLCCGITLISNMFRVAVWSKDVVQLLVSCSFSFVGGASLSYAMFFVYYNVPFGL